MPQSIISSMAMVERVALVGLIYPHTTSRQITDYLDELAFLILTAGGHEVARFTQRIASPDPRTLLGQGKVEEIAAAVEAQQIDLVVFDDELSPSQHRNLEQALHCRIVDRTGLILDIFAQRARTAYAQKQVEMAQYQYLLPRLTGLWTHLERQRGGIGLRGPGETEIETDRRIVRDRIARLRMELQQVDRQMATQRKNREQRIRIALVGYTNVGKSTIMNRLTTSDVLAENKLFATLDTTVRKFSIQGIPCLLSDTVGFIRKLPTQLIDAFKSTLDEVREANILLHVIDISHPSFEEQIATVNEILRDIGASDKPQILLFNKIDLYRPLEEWDKDCLLDKPRGAFTLEELEQTWMGRDNARTIFLSAGTGENIQALKNSIHALILSDFAQFLPDYLLQHPGESEGE